MVADDDGSGSKAWIAETCAGVIKAESARNSSSWIGNVLVSLSTFNSRNIVRLLESVPELIDTDT